MAKAAKKAGGAKKGGKRGNRKPKRSFKTFIKRVLAQGKTKVGLSGKAAAIVNSFVFDQFDRIATQAAQLSRVNKKATLGSREVQSAVRLAFPAELAKHAMAEGAKAVARASA
jgi:histone H2B